MILDVFPSYVDHINKKTLRNPEPHVEEYLKASKNFHATCDMDEAINFADVYFIMVDTPSCGGEQRA